MNIIKLISGVDFNGYKSAYLDQFDGDNYVKLLPTHLADYVTVENSSVVNPCNGAILGEALRVCITPELLEKLRFVDPVNSTPLQLVLIKGELYINPLFRFRTMSLARDTVLIGDIGKDNKINITNFVRVLGKEIIERPHHDSIGIAKTSLRTRKRRSCELLQNHVYHIDFYLRVMKKTSLGIYM